MKAELLREKQIDVQSNDVEQYNMSIDTVNTNKLFSILSESLYNNPIQSLVREYISNAFDAHKELGVEDAVEVGLKKDVNNADYWYCKDVGIGLSLDRVAKVFSKYLSSTKENDDTQIGYFGLGSKSGLSYTDAFFIDTIYDGILYKYCMSKGEENTILTKLSEEPTEDRNGTTIKIYLKSYYDKSDFKKACEEQLAYFDNVYFVDCDIKNDYKLYNYNTFIYSTNIATNSELHICLGKVKYPIDFTALGISRINVPFGLKFNIGELAVTPNRESIRYTSQTKDKILKKLKETVNEICSIYNSKDYLETDIYKYLNNLRNTYKYFEIYPGNNIKINSILSYSDIILKDTIFGPLKHLNLKNLNENHIFKRFYGNYSIGKSGTLTNSNGQVFRMGNNTDNWNNRNNSKFKISGSPDSKKNKYIKFELHPSSQRIELIREHKNSLTLKDYINILSLYDVHKKNYRKHIKDLQDWELSEFNKLSSYDDVTVPKVYLDGLKALKTSNGLNLRKSEGKILVKVAEKSSRYGTLASFVNADWYLKNLFSKRELIVYGADGEDKELLSNVFTFQGKINSIITAKSNHKYFKDIKQFIHIDEFMKGENKAFKRAVTAFKLAKLVKSNAILFKNLELLKKLNSHFSDLLLFISDYSHKHLPSCSDKFGNDCLELAETNNLFDLDAIAVYNEVLSQIDNYKVFNYVKTQSNYNNHFEKSTIDFIVDYLKLKKVRLNTEHYQNKVEIIKEESLELIED